MEKVIFLILLSTIFAQQIVLLPNTGTYNTIVKVSGDGFPDGKCNILGAIVKNFTCFVNNSRISASITMQDEEFGVVPGNYSLTFQFSNNKTAIAYFLLLPPEVVKTNPSITLNPNSGAPGTFVKVSGSGFYTKTKGCEVLSPVASNYKCKINNGILNANFTVNNVEPGNYTILLKTSYNESAFSTFQVVKAGIVYGGFISPQTTGFPIFENTFYLALAIFAILVIIALIYLFILSKKKKQP
jgi:hypothetical protein